MPLVFTPILLVLILVVGHISYQSYMGETHWLLWLLGPATIAFAVPVYENVAVIKRHWMSLSAGVVTAVVVAVTSSVWLARGFMLSDEIQRSGGALGDHALCAGGGETARRSTRSGGAVCGDHRRVWHGGGRYAVLTSCYPGGMAKGAGFGAASHGAGTARSYELGQQEGVVASPVMMLSGVVVVLAAPVVRWLLF